MLSFIRGVKFLKVKKKKKRRIDKTIIQAPLKDLSLLLSK